MQLRKRISWSEDLKFKVLLHPGVITIALIDVLVCFDFRALSSIEERHK